MPNWMYNTLTVEGPKESVLKLKEQLNKPFKQSIQANGDLAYSVKEVNYSNPIFAFWNIIAPEDLEAYHKQPSFEDKTKLWAGDDWYNWNNRNWGSKWDVAVSDEDKYPETKIYREEPNGDNLVIVYYFETAWGCPLIALEKLSAQYPDILFTNEYQEETGWGGEDEFLNGVQTELSSYEWRCYECSTELAEYPDNDCEDCYSVCPNCGFSYDLCDAHLKDYQDKQSLPENASVRGHH